MRETNNLTPSSDVVQPVRVWDLPTRLFHLLLMVCLVGLVVTGEAGGASMQLHFYFGYSVLSLLLFRLVWGVIGGRWSRFTSFVPTPHRVLRYLHDLRAGRHTPSIGHNPMGALSVIAMLGLLLVQVFTGFISDDEIAASGPWTPFVSGNWIALATEYHSEIGKTLILALIVLHVASILFYKRFKNEDLVTPMLQGDKALPADTPASSDTAWTRLLALAVWGACVYVVYLAVNV
jgi:cytochrome b